MDCIGCQRASAVLEISRESPLGDVKEAHRDLVKVWHPDRFGKDIRLRAKAEQRLQEINAAYDHTRECVWWRSSSENGSRHFHEAASGSYSYRREEVLERDEQRTSSKALSHVVLLAIWRSFKIMAVVFSAVLIAALVLLSLVVMLKDYWENEEDIHRHPYRSYPGRTLFDGIAHWTGLGGIAVRGIVFLVSPIVAACAFALIYASNFVDQHHLLFVFALLVLIGLVFLWSFGQESQSKSEEPTRLKEVGGLTVLVVCAAGLAFGWQDIRTFCKTGGSESTQASAKPPSPTVPQREEYKGAPSSEGADAKPNIDEDKPQSPINDVNHDLTATTGAISDSETETDVDNKDSSRTSIDEAVENWRLALLSNVPRRQAAAYADVVERYFLASNWTNVQVASYLEKLHAEGGFSTFEIRDLIIDSQTSSSAELHFTKDFSLERKGVVTSAVCRSVLHLVRQGGEWRINYERDFKS